MFNPDIHHRRSIRLQTYDYAQAGAYFVTICTQKRECVFGEIMNGIMMVNQYGKIVDDCWHDLPNHYHNVVTDHYVIMPDHIHGILVLSDVPVGAGLKPAPTHALPKIIRALKTFSARAINQIRNTPGIPVWQRNYYEHVIRDERSLEKIREYIHINPLKWEYDHKQNIVAQFA